MTHCKAILSIRKVPHEQNADITYHPLAMKNQIALHR